MLVFLDIETTGLESTDKICSIGIVVIDAEKEYSKYELVNESKKISPKASSVNHITDEMIQNKPKLIDTTIYEFLNKHNNINTTIIGHNIAFDMQKLSAIGFKFEGSIIDTLRVSRHLMPECESYALQVLRYDLKLYRQEKQEAVICGIDGDVVSHNALCDALIVKLLYDYLLDIISSNEMYELSFKNVLLQKFEFGKYAGRYIEEICVEDRGYINWMLNSIVDLDEELRYSIKYYINSQGY